MQIRKLSICETREEKREQPKGDWQALTIDSTSDSTRFRMDGSGGAVGWKRVDRIYSP